MICIGLVKIPSARIRVGDILMIEKVCWNEYAISLCMMILFGPY